MAVGLAPSRLRARTCACARARAPFCTRANNHSLYTATHPPQPVLVARQSQGQAKSFRVAVADNVIPVVNILSDDFHLIDKDEADGQHDAVVDADGEVVLSDDIALGEDSAADAAAAELG
jgi:hypothetical protein